MLLLKLRTFYVVGLEIMQIAVVEIRMLILTITIVI